MSKHFLNIPAVYKLGTRWSRYIPTFLSYSISQGIADLSYLFYKQAVKSVKQNLRLALPYLTDRALSLLTVRLFRNYSKYLVDYGRFTNIDKKTILERIVCFDGKGNLENALQMNKGLILLTAHLGNWELGGIFFESYGIRTNVVTIQDNNSQIDDMRKWYRERHNVNTITIGDSPFSTVELLRALSNREAVAMLIDRYHGDIDSITANFFGKSTMFPKGPFTLSRLTGAPIVVAFVVREENGYKGIVERPFMVTSEHDEYEVLKEVVSILEKYIKLYPDQWYNFTPI